MKKPGDDEFPGFFYGTNLTQCYLIKTFIKERHFMLPMRHLLTLFISVFIFIGLSSETNAQNDINKQALETTQVQDEGKVEIKIAGKLYKVAYADEPRERQLGLMYRKKMCENCGMLFKFDSVRSASIWMKNTYIPLDLAYITERGEIVDIEQLAPHDLTSVKSSIPVLYALEMNQGWFANNNVKVGDTVQRLP